ncbi:MAG: hypothetical protein ACOWWO_11995 [Peptococcaceae bacterium]
MLKRFLSLLLILLLCTGVLGCGGTTNLVKVENGEFTAKPEEIIEILNQQAKTYSEKTRENILHIPDFEASGELLELGGDISFAFETGESGNTQEITLQWYFHSKNEESLGSAGFYTSRIPLLFSSKWIDLRKELGITFSKELVMEDYIDGNVHYEFNELGGLCSLHVLPIGK